MSISWKKVTLSKLHKNRGETLILALQTKLLKTMKKEKFCFQQSKYLQKIEKIFKEKERPWFFTIGKLLICYVSVKYVTQP